MDTSGTSILYPSTSPSVDPNMKPTLDPIPGASVNSLSTTNINSTYMTDIGLPKSPSTSKRGVPSYDSIVEPSNDIIPINVACFSHWGIYYQSSTFSYHYGTIDGDLANDGNRNGDYHALSVTHTYSDVGPTKVI